VLGGKNSGGVPWQMDFGKAGLLIDLDNSSEMVCSIEGQMKRVGKG
jgi:hypothetical protein